MSQRIIAAQNRTYETGIKVYDGDEPYELQSGERFVFGVKKHPTDSEYIIRAEITSSDYDSTAETYNLKLPYTVTNIDPGQYYYDVALRYPTGELIKVIPCSDFIVADSVVRSGE